MPLLVEVRDDDEILLSFLADAEQGQQRRRVTPPLRERRKIIEALFEVIEFLEG